MGKGTRGALIGVASVVASLVLWVTGAAAQEDTNALANWTNGSGDCPEGGVEQIGGNGTAYLAEFDIDADVVVEDGVLTVTFIGYDDNAFFSPVTGPLDSDRTFDLHGSYEVGDEDYDFRGSLVDNQLIGTFERQAHFQEGISGPRCTAMWDVTVTVSERALEVPGGGSEPIGSDDGDDGISIWVCVLVLGSILAILGLWFAFGRTRQRPPKEGAPEEGGFEDDKLPQDEPEIQFEEVGDKVEEAPPPVKVSEEPTCECSGHIVINGRSTLGVCECLKLDWLLEHFKIGPGTGVAEGSIRHKSVLVKGQFPDGDMFCRRRYYAERIIGECTGGGSIPDAEHGHMRDLEWDAKQGPGPDELTLKCSAKAGVLCPKDGLSYQRFEGEMVIKLERVKCEVSIVINEDAYYKGESGHTGVRIRCGEYDTTFGYFPEDSPQVQLAGFKGKSHVSQVSSRDDTQADSVTSYYNKDIRREYVFAAACRDCERLRGRWNDLAKKPGQFQLYDNNCTSTAVELVSGIVQLPDKLGENFFSFGLKSPSRLNELLAKGKLTPIMHPAGTAFAPPDH